MASIIPIEHNYFIKHLTPNGTLNVNRALGQGRPGCNGNQGALILPRSPEVEPRNQMQFSV